ncbi:MAG TPA: hypothetical protein VMW70_05035 [Burkholderiales bacterium]|nr:hypothetical protein [Burkholderiales bacterium]
MWWTAVFWIVYGVGSTLFVFYLFKLGNSVANGRKMPVEKNVKGLHGAGSDMAMETPAVAGAPLDYTRRPHVLRAQTPGVNNVTEPGLSIDTKGVTIPMLAQTSAMLQADSALHRQEEKLS